jgi:hypothetical protein
MPEAWSNKDERMYDHSKMRKPELVSALRKAS